jgi:hypothetical protein
MDVRMWVDACTGWQTVHACGWMVGQDNCVEMGFGLWMHGCVDAFGFTVALGLVDAEKHLGGVWGVGIMLGSRYGCAIGCIKVSGLGCVVDACRMCCADA